MAEQDDGISASAPPQGAIVTSVYARRDVIYYPVNDHELESIANHNTQQTVFASVGSFLAAVIISIGVSLLIEHEEKQIGLTLMGAMVILGLLAIAVFVLAFVSRRASATEVHRVKEQSRSMR